ncbi:MAG: methylmalonyl Co-A mutase-associated GTPase MeaB [Tepidibacillus sp.]|uniref:methylmalonyl Co-A mutase-associated GTPase MeaB n=1 Tax=Tepidibacillus sp. HK-1 TaxID=1883407 RepID=UPI000852ADF4|nr:methylmalonyl Co-A mutase-associated GTPase MeaB [Tepidibacillus sp. HK-1]GBF12535.1 putative GTPase ArgK [Tepidibacillus sp. HK-1]
MENLLKQILEGNKRSVGKAISIIENDLPEKVELLNQLYPYTGHAKVIGITGPPGAGKSTLVDAIIQVIRQTGAKVGVIAVDPTSPFTGGAILGDRIRMQKHALDPNVFIRSMGSRGTLGGLAKATREVVRVLDSMGNDYILIETVGVGQSELEIINVADTIMVVLHPGGGDTIQAFKAGLMEIADLFVINKSDLPGVEKLIHEIEMLIEMTKINANWKPPIIKTISTNQVGLEELWAALQNHQQYLIERGVLQKQRTSFLKREVVELLHHLFQQKIDVAIYTQFFNKELDQLVNKERSPEEIARIMFEKLCPMKS